MSLSQAANPHSHFQSGTMQWPEDPVKYNGKKFGYKAKALRYPLRSSKADDENEVTANTQYQYKATTAAIKAHAEQREATKHDDVTLRTKLERSDNAAVDGGVAKGRPPRAAPPRRSNSADDSGGGGGRTGRGSTGGGSARHSGGTQQPHGVKKRSSGDRGGDAAKENTKPSATAHNDSVTLTQEQLARILATIGQVSGLSTERLRLVLGGDQELSSKRGGPLVAGGESEKQAHNDAASESVERLKRKAALTPLHHPEQATKSQSKNNGAVEAAASDAAKKSPQGSVTIVGNGAPLAALSPPIPLPPLHKGHMTMAEQKRRQWELERQELVRLQREREELAAVGRPAAADRLPPELTREPAPPASLPPRLVRRARTPQQAPPAGGNGGLPLTATATATTHVEPTYVPGLGFLDGPKRLAPSETPRETAAKSPAAAFVTMADRKRQQWASEQEHMLPEYNPWGKPGGGVNPSMAETASVAYDSLLRPGGHGGLQENRLVAGGVHDVAAVAATSSYLAAAGSAANLRLSMAELKRLQWEKDKANVLPAYDPWGRPGAGVNPNAATEAAADEVKLPRDVPAATEPKRHRDVPAVLASLAPHQGSTYIGDGSRPLQLLPHNENPSGEGPRPPPLPPTRAELMKMKWANEKVENSKVLYDPWGRPGAGAPIRSSSGRVLTDYHSRLNEVIQSSFDAADNSVGNGGTWASKPDESRARPDYRADATAASTLTHVRSRSDSAPIQLGSDATFQSPRVTGDGTGAASRSHLRGQLVPLDPVTVREREDQRRRQLQHQDEIRRQVEEKQRIQREQAERRAREEAELERRLQDDRGRLQAQFDVERSKLRKKEIDEEERIVQLKAAMDKAQMAAEAAKAAKTLSKLQLAGHDVSQLKAAYAEKLSPRPPGEESSTAPLLRHAAASIDDSTAVSGAALTLPSDGGASSSATELHIVPRIKLPILPAVLQEAYVENRTLTPSQHRRAVAATHSLQSHAEPLSPQREFGTQTEDRKSSAKGNATSDAAKGAASHHRDVKDKSPHRPEAVPEAQRRANKKDKQPWGYQNKERAQYVKQSKKDVDFEQKHPLEAERKVVREKKLMKLVEANSPRIPAHSLSRPGKLHVDREAKVDKGIQGISRVKDVHSKRPVGGSETASTIVPQPPPRHAGSTQEVATVRPRRHVSPVVTAANSNSNGGFTERLLVTPTEDFMAFTRSDVVLDPVKAAEPIPVSRETTANGLAREAYNRLMRPAAYGVPMDIIQDGLGGGLTGRASLASLHAKDPLFHPNLLQQHHPTARQDQLMEQLRLMRQGLLQKQREIETSHLTPETAAPEQK